jgi:hypothetical protein
MGNELTLVFEIVEEDAEPEALERAMRGLRRDLIEIDSVSTEQVGGPDQPGAKGDIGLLGTIAVSMLSSAVPAVVTLLGRWLQERRRVVLRVTKEDGTTVEIPHTLDRHQIDQIVASLLPR